MELEALPKGLRKLISLCHLEFSIKQTLLPVNEIANLSSLEILTVESSPNLESIFGGVKFPVLKVLNVSDFQSLKFFRLDGKNFPELETLIVDACHNLDLEMWKGNHHEEQMPKLKLKLLGFSSLSQLVVLPKWLQEVANSLQHLLISNCYNIETLPDWLTTLTHLKTLSIKNLVSLSDNIHHLSALETLIIRGCPNLCEKYEPHVGQFWPEISHIKDISIGALEESEKN
ncbi:disease resistance protein RGA2-like [Phaseolus vulgaris]|uniref:disease resistance protein RGA2-like n=1 Tax=Phaseolus vulgaris TaxID=3885 RepID=UPI0035CCA3D2